MRMPRLKQVAGRDLDLYFARDLFKLFTSYLIQRERAQWEKIQGEITASAPHIRLLEEGDSAELYQLHQVWIS
jgi:hypothetical protein